MCGKETQQNVTLLVLASLGETDRPPSENMLECVGGELCWGMLEHSGDHVPLNLPRDFKISLRKLAIMWLVALLSPMKRLLG